ncbi:hypothetical protein B566_EDAN017767 [Ephemera danica]|nr:hypothetical protein B566_EDAN017767 [Ephemera danica]
MGHTVVDILVYTARERHTEWPPLSFAETNNHKPVTRRSPRSSPRTPTTHKSPPPTQPTTCMPPKKTPEPPIQPPPKEPLLVTAASKQDSEAQELTIVGEAPATTGDTKERSPAAAAPHAVEPSPPCILLRIFTLPKDNHPYVMWMPVTIWSCCWTISSR